MCSSCDDSCGCERSIAACFRETRNQIAENEVCTPEVVIPKMPWKCRDCGHKWMDRQDCKGAHRGCPECGSRRLFDCNLSAIRKTRAMPLLFSGRPIKIHNAC